MNIKQPSGLSPITRVLGNLKVWLGKTVSAASIHMNYTTCQGAFADGFHDEFAGNIAAFSGHARDDNVLTP